MLDLICTELILLPDSRHNISDIPLGTKHLRFYNLQGFIETECLRSCATEGRVARVTREPGPAVRTLKLRQEPVHSAVRGGVSLRQPVRGGRGGLGRGRCQWRGGLGTECTTTTTRQ